MPRVKNLVTGLEHDVPPGHFSLTRPDRYEVLPDKPKPVPEPEAAPVKAEPKKPAKK